MANVQDPYINSSYAKNGAPAYTHGVPMLENYIYISHLDEGLQYWCRPQMRLQTP